jgi:monoamine oxidase
MILGAGLSGLYTAYTLLKKNPDRTLHIIEASNRVGGRIHTYQDEFMKVEAGAGRFSDQHELLFQLIHELELSDKIRPIKNESTYTEQTPFSVKYIVGKIVVASKLDLYNDLTSMSFLEYAQKIVTQDEINFLKDAFGYSNELTIMNAKDAIALMGQLNASFYILEGGLSQIIQRLVHQIRLYPNVIFHLNEPVVSITKRESVYTITTTQQKYSSKLCICTLPKQILEQMPISKSFRSSLKKIKCGSLCRIYCTFKTPWFKGMPKYTTANPLRMIIPYTENTIMISYSDSKYADFWNDLHKRYGTEGVNHALQEFIYESLNIKIPTPIKTNVFYWKCGVGYWGIHADSEKIASKLIQPFSNFYVCGEHYSATHQQWMEGALETAHKVCSMI